MSESPTNPSQTDSSLTSPDDLRGDGVALCAILEHSSENVRVFAPDALAGFLRAARSHIAAQADEIERLRGAQERKQNDE